MRGGGGGGVGQDKGVGIGWLGGVVQCWEVGLEADWDGGALLTVGAA